MIKGLMIPHWGTAIEHKEEVKLFLQLIAEYAFEKGNEKKFIVEFVDTIVRNFCHQPFLPVVRKGPPWKWKYDLSKPNPEYFDHLEEICLFAVGLGLTIQHDILTYPTLKHRKAYPCFSNNINGVKVDINSFTLKGMRSNPGLTEAVLNLIEWLYPIIKMSGQCLPVLEGCDGKVDNAIKAFMDTRLDGTVGIRFLSNCYKGPGFLFSHHGHSLKEQASKAPSDDGTYHFKPKDFAEWARIARRRRCYQVFTWLNGWPSGYKKFENGRPVGRKLKYHQRPWIGLEDWYGILGQSFVAFVRA